MNYIDEQMGKNVNENEFKEFNLNSTIVVKFTQIGLNRVRAFDLDKHITQRADGFFEIFTSDLFSFCRICNFDNINELIEESILIPNTFLKDINDKNQKIR